MSAPEQGYALDAMASIEAENALVGGLMLDNSLFDHVGDILIADDFFSHDARIIFQATAALINSCKPADVITVREQLAGAIELPRLNEIAQFVPSLGSARRYAEIIRSKSLNRKLMAVGEKITEVTQDAALTVEQRIDTVGQAVSALLEHGPKRNDWQTPDVGMVEFLDGIQARADGDQTFVSFGIDALDQRLDGGGRPGDLIVIAARPSMGKTALALAIGEHVAQAQGGVHSVGILSMEMPSQQVQARRVSMAARVPLTKIKLPDRMNREDWERVTEAVESIRSRPVYVSDQAVMTINQVRTKARALKRKHGLRLLVVDYIGLMDGTDKRQQRNVQLGEVSRGMKALAKELGITILLLAQLNREVEKRVNQRPILSDLRDCGDIEQDADVVLFVHRPIVVKPDLGPEWRYFAELIIAKNRDGATAVLEAQYIGENVTFSNWPANLEKPRALTRTARSTEL